MKKALKKLAVILAVTGTLCLIFYAVWNIRLTDIVVEGNTYYTDEEVRALLFPEDNDTRTIYALWNREFGRQREIPFIKSYEITITGINCAEVMVYEKSLIGYIPYMGTYLYFDVEGYIVEASSEKIDGLLFIDGIGFDYFVLNSKLPVEDSNLFYATLVLSRLINESGLKVDRVYFDRNMKATLYMGGILVWLGEATELEKKIHTLVDIWPQIKNEEGTLYLDDYSMVNDVVEYVFKKNTKSGQ